MRNSGFVTDSDTERELQKWVQPTDLIFDAMKVTIANLQARVKKLEDWQE